MLNASVYVYVILNSAHDDYPAGKAPLFQADYCFVFTLHLGLTDRKVKAPEALLSWNAIHERLPWSIVLLMGGGYALAAGSEVNTHEHRVFHLKDFMVM